MAINIKFDLAGNPEPPTIILANRSGNKLGQLNVDVSSIDLTDKFNDASEFSFTLYKYVDNEIVNLWDSVADFKLVYCKEWDMWFEIKVELDESNETVKTVFCTQLGQAELSQIMLYNIEINTEVDIERDDYKITILYDEKDKDASLLHRLLKDKAPHYSIIHVDETIKKIQRRFSFDSTSIADAFQEIAEEIGCLFVYNSNSDKNGKIQRTISVYDLRQNCSNCGYRGEYTDVCPKCGSKNIKYGYGEDTLIFVTSDELASEGIQFTTDSGSVKNCFKLEAGDDLMTSTVRNCNPNGTDYIWRFSEFMKEDMSSGLVEKLNSYDEVYRQYYNEHQSNIDASLLSAYNLLVDNYSKYNEDLQKIVTPIKGYPSLMNVYYNTVDMALYLQSELMPSIEMSETNATEQVGLLTASSLSPVAVSNIDTASLSTVNSAVLAMAKIVVKSTYKTEIKTSEYNSDTKIWKGSFVIENYSDEEDTAVSDVVSIEINGDLETFVKQKIERSLNKGNTDDLSISGLFKKEYDDFCKELKKYALNPLISFHDACQACIDIMIEQGVGSDETWGSSEEGSESNLYEQLYVPYYNKLKAIESEMKIRENEIGIILGTYDIDGNLITNGLQSNVLECRNEIQDALDFEKYLGEELWVEFCSYRREDTYSNENYTSDGLNNTELFDMALEFIEVAENEIFKSSESQCSISTTLNNLLAIEKFKPLVKFFKVGNWIRVRVDNKIYKLRLIEYGIDFGSFENINVDFSDATRIKNGTTDVQDVLSQASSMASSYSSVKRQASQGNEIKEVVDQWIDGGLNLEKGLNSALDRIKTNNSEEITLTKNGLLCRSYDDVLEDYSLEQFKLTHNIMAYTTDGWKTVSCALGKHDYEYYDDNKIKQQDTDYGLTAKFVTAGYVNGSQIIGGEIYSQNYTPNTGAYMNLNNGDFSWAGGKIKYDQETNELDFTGRITSVSGDIGGFTIEEAYLANGTTSLAGAANSVYLGTDGISCGTNFKVTNGGVLTASDVDVTGKITASSGEISGNLNISGSLIHESDNYRVTLRGVQANKGHGVFYITDNTSGTATYPFRVNGDGSFSATKAEITGKIYADGGTIANWNIGTNTISKNVTVDGKKIITGIQQPANGIYAFFAGTYNGSNYSDCEFRVTHQGKLYASSAVISGDSTFGGELSGVTGSFTNLTAGQSYFAPTYINIAAKVKNSEGQYIDGYIRIGAPNYSDWEDITIRPSHDNCGNIGTPSHRWDMLYVKNGAIHSSDRNYKTDITKMNEKHEQLFNLLSPVTFKFIDSTYDRFHYGFISQEVEDAIIESGLTAKDFAGFCKDIKCDNNGLPLLDKDGNPEYVYSLRYTEFIALNTHMIQKVQAENQKLKERIDLLEKALEKML